MTSADGKEKYTIGIDFGTLSGRAVLVRVRDGKVMAESSRSYEHGVIEKDLPQGWALENPADFDATLFGVIRDVMAAVRGNIDPVDVIGIAVDTTSATLIPVDGNGTPLCFLPEFRDHPHAWCKLWKHHAAQAEADRMTALALERQEDFIEGFGGKISSEWTYPKIMQILKEDPAVYEAADLFLDACDYLVLKLTGIATANICSASFKGQYSRQRGGYLSASFVKELDPALADVSGTKLRAPVIPLGSCAGTLTKEAASLCGLVPGIAVAAGNVDAHVSVPGAGINKPNEMLMIIGTSICSMVCAPLSLPVPGICGYVADGILPGLYGYEAGQPCAGDCLAWYTDTGIPQSYTEAAKNRGMSVHQYLTALAEQKKPGASGLLALDWWNGNRSVLNHAGLSGLILGYTLDTKPEDIYRALIEASAYGVRKIRDNFVLNGVAVDRIYACGGISLKNRLFMQIFSDVLNSDIYVSPCTQTPALGCAMFAAVAAGTAKGGYEDIYEAIEHMADRNYMIYRPVSENVPVYDRLYSQYEKVHDFFGKEAPGIMETLKALSRDNEEF